MSNMLENEQQQIREQLATQDRLDAETEARHMRGVTPEAVHALIDRLAEDEMTDIAPDAREMLRNERLCLQSAMQRHSRRQVDWRHVVDVYREAQRVRAMWTEVQS